MGSKLLDEVMVLGTGGGVDSEAECLGRLNGKRAYTARCTPDQDRLFVRGSVYLVSSGMPIVVQAVKTAKGKTAPSSKGEIVWKWDDSFGLCQSVLLEGTVVGGAVLVE
jgi:hypothetical protein